MAERDTRNEKIIEDFVLVRSDKTPIYKDKDVTVRVIGVTKEGPEFEVIKKDENDEEKRIGIVKGDKTFKFDSSFKKELRARMEKLYGKFKSDKMYESLGFDNAEIKYDVIEKLNEQQRVAKNNEKDKEQKLENVDGIATNEQNNDDKNKEDEKKKNNKNNIEKKDIKGKNITKITPLKPNMSNSVPGYTNLTAVEEDRDNLTFYGKNSQTGEIEEVKSLDYGEKAVQRRGRDGREYVTNSGTIKKIAGGPTLAIDDTKSKDLEVNEMQGDIDGDGIENAREVSTSQNPTKSQELQNGEDLTETQAIKWVEEHYKRNSDIRNKVINDIKGQETITIDEIKELYEQYDKELEETEEEMRGRNREERGNSSSNN